MKKLFILAIAIISLFSCTENHYYPIELDVIKESIDIISIKQITEESREEFNFEITFENNSRIDGEILIQLVDLAGSIVYEQVKILTRENGTITTGKIRNLKIEEHILILKNVEGDYAYLLSDTEEVAHNSQYRVAITPALGEFEFTSSINRLSDISGNRNHKISTEEITLTGGGARLQILRLYKKINNSDVKPWNLYEKASLLPSFLNSVDMSQENNWIQQGAGYYSIDIPRNAWFNTHNPSHIFEIYEKNRGASENTQVEMYTEYIFIDLYNQEYKFQTEVTAATITAVENIDDIDIEVDNIEEGEGVQQAIEYEGEVVHTSIQIERTDIYMTMDIKPWETFSEAKLEITNGAVVVIDNLNNADKWSDLGNNKYRLQITGYSDAIEALDSFQHQVSFKLQNNIEEVEIDTYIQCRYIDTHGTSEFFRTHEEDFEVRD